MAREAQADVAGAPDERLDEVVGASEDRARELRRPEEPEALVRIEGIVAAVVPVSRSEGRGRPEDLGELGGRRGLARRDLRAAHGEVRLHVFVLVEHRPAVEEAEALAEESVAALSPLVDVQVADVVAVEGRSDRLVAVHEPGDRVREVVVVGDLPDLRGQAQRLAPPQEIPRLKGELPEEAVQGRVSRAELDLVSRGLRALEGQIDLLLGRAHPELGLLVDLEVAELLELLEALLDRLHVHHVAFVQGELPPDDLVAGAWCCP